MTKSFRLTCNNKKPHMIWQNYFSGGLNMLIDKIDFRTFNDLGSNIMPIIVNEEEEINGKRLEQTHQALYDKFTAICSSYISSLYLFTYR